MQISGLCIILIGSMLHVIRQERKLFETYQKQVRAMPDKKEREEIDMLRTQVTAQNVGTETKVISHVTEVSFTWK